MSEHVPYAAGSPIKRVIEDIRQIPYPSRGKKKSKVVKGNALGPGRSDKFKWFSKRFKVVSVADK